MRAVLLLCLTLAVSNSRQSPNVETIRDQLPGGRYDNFFGSRLQFPYMALLMRVGGEPICGGVIVSNAYIITVASCVKEFAPRDLTVFVGDTTLVGRHGDLMPVKGITMHPKYDSVTNDYDIAVIQLLKPIDPRYPNFKAASVGLNEPAVGDKVTVPGWGPTVAHGASSYELNSAKLYIVSRDECQKSFGDKKLTDRMICAFAEGKGACKDDIGGQMLTGNITRGVISFGADCTGKHPIGFTKMNGITDWLQSVTNGNIHLMP